MRNASVRRLLNMPHGNVMTKTLDAHKGECKVHLLHAWKFDKSRASAHAANACWLRGVHVAIRLHHT
jgi:hypothetical protein